ncbi:hypothetical protein X743_14845 [Mesorhizobium sp. LNHC252B00]|uniref:HEPN domain-containing protein n=1 Tax=Mesorhizobium sp. LNHC252B00 TaxID=1287252 RepID=UPI0003CF8C66|nr:HEPN domain-containing protein [Mesorhizobium sp. LNHC252B00]ESY72786.1 hypothetical protein X743_14845 [Mesorhizobium sp. LNHC252B00]
MSLLDALKAHEEYATHVKAGTRSLSLSEEVQAIQKAIAHAFGAGKSIGFGSKQIVTGGASPNLAMVSLFVLAERGPAQTAEWLERVHSIAAAGKANVRLVVEIVGADSPEPIKFSNGVIVTRLTELHPSPNVCALAENYNISAKNMTFHFHRPMVAVYEEALDAAAGAVAERPMRSSIDQVLLGLSASGEIFPNAGYFWHEFTDPELEAAVFGRAWGADQAGQPPVGKVTKEAVAYAEKFLALSGDLARRCQIAAHRLRSARSRRDHSQRVIDISVALESLLLPPESGSEISHRLKTRAAMLLGSTYDERKDLAKVVSSFYSIRSKVVHGAVVGPHQHQLDTIGQTQKLAERLLRIEIDMGRTPDFAAIDLGGPA